MDTMEVAYDGVLVAGLKYRLPVVLDVLEEIDTGRPPTIKLEREPTNSHDENAIKVVAEPGRLIGYLPAIVAESVAFRRYREIQAELVVADIDDAMQPRIEIRVLAAG